MATIEELLGRVRASNRQARPASESPSVSGSDPGRVRSLLAKVRQQTTRVDPKEFQASEDKRARRVVDKLHGRNRTRGFLGDVGGILTDPEALDVGARSVLQLNPAMMGRDIAERITGTNEDARAAAFADLRPDDAIFDVRDQPLGAATVDMAETLLGPGRIGQTALDETGSVAKPLAGAAVALGTAFGAAPRLAQALAPAGQRIAAATAGRIGAQNATGALAGAGLGAAFEMRGQGLEEPENIATSAAAGLGAGLLPINTLGAVAASMGYDLLTGAAEAIRRDPASAQIVNKMIDGQEVSGEERQHLVTQGVMYAIPSVVGNVAAYGAARVGENQQRALKARGLDPKTQADRQALRSQDPVIQERVERFRRETMMADDPEAVVDESPLGGWEDAFDVDTPKTEKVYFEGVTPETIARELAEQPTVEATNAQEVRSDPGQPEVVGQVRPGSQADSGGDVQQGAQARPAAGDAQEIGSGSPWELTRDQYIDLHDSLPIGQRRPYAVPPNDILPTYDWVRANRVEGMSLKDIFEGETDSNSVHILGVANAMRKGIRIKDQVLSDYPGLKRIQDKILAGDAQAQPAREVKPPSSEALVRRAATIDVQFSEVPPPKTQSWVMKFLSRVAKKVEDGLDRFSIVGPSSRVVTRSEFRDWLSRNPELSSINEVIDIVPEWVLFREVSLRQGDAENWQYDPAYLVGKKSFVKPKSAQDSFREVESPIHEFGHYVMDILPEDVSKSVVRTFSKYNIDDLIDPDLPESIQNFTRAYFRSKHPDVVGHEVFAMAFEKAVGRPGPRSLIVPDEAVDAVRRLLSSDRPILMSSSARGNFSPRQFKAGEGGSAAEDRAFRQAELNEYSDARDKELAERRKRLGLPSPEEVRRIANAEKAKAYADRRASSYREHVQRMTETRTGMKPSAPQQPAREVAPPVEVPRSEAFNLGKEQGSFQAAYNTNPYKPGSKRHKEYEAGWQASRGEAGVSELYMASRPQDVPDTVEAKTAIGNEVTERGDGQAAFDAIETDLNAPIPRLGKGPPRSTPPRVMPEPIAGGEIKPYREVLQGIEKAFGTTLLQGARMDPAVRAKYSTESGGITTRNFNDLDGTAHEVAHRLDDQNQFGNYPKDPTVPKAEADIYDGELIPAFSAHGSPSRNPAVVRMEGVAEWVRAWIVNPKAAQAAAPQFHKRFMRKTTAEQRTALREFGDGIRRQQGARALDQINAGVDMWGPDRQPTFPVPTTSAGVRKVLKDSWDYLQSLTTFGNIYGHQDYDKLLAKLGLLPSDLNPEENIIMLYSLMRGRAHAGEEILTKGMPTLDHAGRRTPGFLNYLIEPLVVRGDMTSSKKVAEEAVAYTIAGTLAPRIDKIRLEAATRLADMQDEINALVHQQAALMDGISSSKNPATVNQLTGALHSLNAKIRMKSGAMKQVGVDVEAQIEGMINATGGFPGTEKVIRRAIDEINALPDKGIRAKEFAKRYKEVADSVIDTLVDAGRYTRAEGKTIKDSTDIYAAMNRVGKDLTPSFGETFKGSSRDIRNPIVNLMGAALFADQFAFRNNFYKNYTGLLKTGRKMYGPDYLDSTEFGQQADVDGAITVWRDGKKEKWVIPENIKNMIDPPARLKLSDRLATTRKFKQEHPKLTAIGKAVVDLGANLTWLTARTIVSSPQFMSRSVLREPVWSYVQTGASIPDFYRFLWDGENNPDIQKFISAGGSQAAWGLSTATHNHVEAYYGIQRSVIEAMVGDKSKTTVILPASLRAAQNALNKWNKYIVQRPETANRMMEFKRAYKEAKAKGYDERNSNLYAAYHARDMLDYAEAGHLVAQLRGIVPFLNAGIQGQRSTIRKLQKDPQGWLLRNSAAVILPSAIAFSWNAMQGEDVMALYDELPSYRKLFFYNLYVPMLNDFVMIPKPFEMGLTWAPVEAGLRTAMTGENKFGEYLQGALVSSVPGSATRLAAGGYAPFLEALMNYSPFYDRNIVPPNETQEPRLRDMSRASRISQILAHSFNGVTSNTLEPVTGLKVQVDARAIDHIITNTTGGWGRLGLTMGDIGRKDKITRSSDWVGAFTGLIRQAPGADAQSVGDALRFAASLKQMNDPGVQELIQFRREFFDTAHTPDERRKKSLELIRMAKDVIKDLKEMAPDIETDMLERNEESRMERELSIQQSMEALGAR